METNHISSLNRVVNVKTGDCGCIVENIGNGKIEILKIGKKGKRSIYNLHVNNECLTTIDVKLLHESLGRLLGEPVVTGDMPDNKYRLIDCIRLGYLPGRDKSE